SPVVLTGDDNGSVNVYKLKKLNGGGAGVASAATEGAVVPGSEADAEAQANVLKEVIMAKRGGGGQNGRE
ncbi:hypothetical protein HKX48_003549, partial [Thoreauomyces humboldtii]